MAFKPARGDTVRRTPPDFDAVVIGAGPAGSAAAAALADCGHRVLLVERDRLPRHKVCGEFLSPEAQDTLRVLGLHDALARQSPQLLTHVELHDRRGRRLHRPLPGNAWGISRYVLDDALAREAVTRGVSLSTNTMATRTTRQGDRYAVVLRRKGQEQTVTARAVLAAAGRQVSAALYPEAEPRRAPNHHGTLTESVGVKRHYTGLSQPPRVELYLCDAGYAGINAVEGGRSNLCLLIDRSFFRRAGGTVDGVIDAISSANPALARRLGEGQPLAETTKTVAAVDTEAPACPWQGLPRLGDAAVMLPPLCGDGMAMALRSAELCCAGADAFLRGDWTLAEWEAHYTAAWHAEFRSRVRLARGLQRLLLTPSLTGGLLTLGSWLPWAADYFVRATRGAVKDNALDAPR